MSKILEYNGYSGSVDASIEDHCLFGRILFITDLVTYEAETVADLEAEFVAAVDDYILTCKEVGKEPQRPFKGSFNVRISPELHRKAALQSIRESISLNELTSKAIDTYLNKPIQPINIEQHHHYHQDQSARTYSQRLAIPETTGENEWTVNPSKMSTSH
jgi:predicted HicB family RNase H-like nuclease